MTATFRGISFPFSSGSVTTPKGVEDSELIRQSMIQILLTGYGERLMRPDFGSGIHKVVFGNNDALLVSQIEAEVFSAIGKYEPRAIVQRVAVDRPSDAELVVTITYVVVATKQQDSLELKLATPQ